MTDEGGRRVRMRRRTAGAAAVAAALAVLLASCTGSPSSSPAPTSSSPASRPTAGVPADLRSYYAQVPSWKACGSLQCTTVAVPLDYAHPAKGSLDLALNRAPATDPGSRIGSLLVNPGGPGGSGVDFVRDNLSMFPSSVRAAYDVVGFDPRGVVRSDPVDCLSNPALDVFIAADGSPDTTAEVARSVALSKGLVRGCERLSARELPYVGTANAARDMDVLRAVLGDSTLHYLGFSYGTYLGATYAGEFPKRVGRMVLDGAIDPSLTALQLARAQAVGFQGALSAFVDDCLTVQGCPVGPTAQDALDQIDRLLARTDVTPLPSASGRPVTQSLAMLGIVVTLYDKTNGWPALRIALKQALDGDGSVLLQLADLYTDRSADGTYKTNSNEVIYAVNCYDRPDRSTPAQLQRYANAWSVPAPTFGAYLAWGELPCRFWPAQTPTPPQQIHAPGAPPIVVVGTTRDPATPYAWAVSLAHQLDSGVLVSRNGDGHTSFGSGNACVDDAVSSYLVDGTVPKDGLRC